MNKEIAELKHRLAKIESMKDYQRELEKRFEQNNAKLEVAYAMVKKENKDVEKLKHASFSSIMAWIAKDKEERLIKEEQEALQAALYLKQLQEETALINEELVHCEEEISQEDAIREALQRLQKEEALKGPKKEEVQQLYDKLEQETMLEKELQEAIEASYVVTDQLKHAVRELDSASSWGIYDIAGGGMVSSMIKHSHVDEAQQSIAQIQKDMRRFQKELRDVSNIELSEVQMDEWLKFSDIFLDNVLFDFMALSKINDSKAKLNKGLASLIQLQDELLNQKCACLERKLTLDNKLNKLYQSI